jgi:CubicO group peptidase (beta-lactamase class C family)
MTPKNVPPTIDRRRFLELATLAGGAVVVSTLPGCQSRDTQATSKGTVASPGFTSDGLARVRTAMTGYVDRGAMPGLITVVSRGDELHIEPIGMKAVGGTEPMRRDTIFRIASMTKPITAAATLLLVEDGKLRLEEPVDRLLPELANRRVLRRPNGALDDTVPAARSITVRDLLTFTMGLGLVFPVENYPVLARAIELDVMEIPPRPHTPPAPDEWMRRLGTLPLMHQPGERWVYNTGSDVLGVLIARASGQSFETFLQQRLFQPLGMKDTGFTIAAEKLNRLTPVYWANATTKALDVFDGASDTAYARPPAFPSGAGGLLSTADDFLAFARMLLNKGEHGGARIMSAQSIEMMTRDQLTPEQKRDAGLFPNFFATSGWGYGVSVVTGPDEVSATPGRYGWFGGFGTYWYSDSTRDLVGLLLTPRVFDDVSPAQDFWKAVYQALEA